MGRIGGPECAENLSLGPEWKVIKSYHRRTKAFIASPRWQPTPKGCRIEEHGYSALVFRTGNGFKVKISKMNQEHWLAPVFASEASAKQEVFRLIERKRIPSSAAKKPE